MSESNIILYTTPNSQVSIQVQYEDGSFWLTQKRMAELFGVDVVPSTSILKTSIKAVNYKTPHNYPENPDSSKRKQTKGVA